MVAGALVCTIVVVVVAVDVVCKFVVLTTAVASVITVGAGEIVAVPRSLFVLLLSLQLVMVEAKKDAARISVIVFLIAVFINVTSSFFFCKNVCFFARAILGEKVAKTMQKCRENDVSRHKEAMQKSIIYCNAWTV